MTAAQLHRLAELNEEAAQWTTNPAWARTFQAAAHMARLAAERQAKAERVRELRASLQAIEPFLTLCNRSRFRSDHIAGLLAVGCW